jgi:hypothetical protein
MRKTFDQPAADRIGDICENNRDCPGHALKGNIDGSGMRDDHVGLQSYDLGDISTDLLDVGPRGDKAIVDLDIAACAHCPAELPQIIKQRGDFSLRDRIVFKPRDHHADAALELLRTHRERPSCCAAEKRYERAPLHSITSSAMESTPGGTSIPSDRAV